MDTITAGDDTFTVTRATRADVPAIVALLSDDMLGAGREPGGDAGYLEAFDDIDSDPHQFLGCVRDSAGAVVGTFQLTLIRGLSRGGARRLEVGSVRIASSLRSRGLGSAVFAWIHAYGRRHGAVLAQLTTDNRRVDAHRFYDRLGYQHTHRGYKLPLAEPPAADPAAVNPAAAPAGADSTIPPS